MPALAPLTNADRRVLRLLEIPPVRVWPRKRLAAEAHIADRTMRQAIERLRLHGHAICMDSSSAGGYWIATDAEEIASMRAELMSRGHKLFTVAAALKFKEDALREQEITGQRQPKRVALI